MVFLIMLRFCPAVNDRIGVALCIGNLSPRADFMLLGIYYDPGCSSRDLNHGVLLVGYGTDASETGKGDYWLIKNRYGTPGIIPVFGIKMRISACDQRLDAGPGNSGLKH